MSTSDARTRSVSARRRTNVAVVLGALAALLVLRCAAPETCVRISDCDDGYTCVSGTCRLAGDTPSSSGDGSLDERGVPSEASTTSDSASDGEPPTDANADVDASADATASADAASVDASGLDAAKGDASDASGD